MTPLHVRSAATACLVGLLMSGSGVRSQSTQVPDLPDSPRGLPEHIAARLSKAHEPLAARGATLRAAVTAYHSTCDRVPENDRPAIQRCGERSAALNFDWTSYYAALDEYTATLREWRKRFPLPAYVASGHGLVLGLTAVGGFNVPPSGAPATSARVRAQEEMRFLNAQIRAGNRTPNVQIRTDGYHFILGLATVPSGLDVRELWRALGDNVYNGLVSQQSREAYPSLKGRSFDTLECHSNGAMVCLAAMRSGDLAAASVKLLGPQVTRESLVDWQWLVDQRYTNAVKIYIMNGDPIPWAAQFVGGVTTPTISSTADDFRRLAMGLAPAIPIEALPCPPHSPEDRTAVSCHNARFYQDAIANRP